MNNDLIERLKAEIEQQEAWADDGESTIVGSGPQLMREAIAALSPVLPEDVQIAINFARGNDRQDIADLIERLANEIDHYSKYNKQLLKQLATPVPDEIIYWIDTLSGKNDEVADLIERLARERDFLKKDYDAVHERADKLQARIEELEGEFETVLAGRGDTATRLLAQIAEYQKLAQAVKEEIIHEDGTLVEFYRNNKELFSRQEGKFFRRAFDSKLLDGIMLKKKMK